MASYHRVGWLADEAIAAELGARVRLPDPSDTGVTYHAGIYRAGNGHATHGYIIIYTRRTDVLPSREVTLLARRIYMRRDHPTYRRPRSNYDDSCYTTGTYDATYDHLRTTPVAAHPTWPIISPTGIAP